MSGGSAAREYPGTYVHLGRKAESILAPDMPRPFPLKLASLMCDFIVTGWLFVPSPLKVNVASALALEKLLDISVGSIRWGDRGVY
jgi:hypothetical protein